MNDLTAVYVVPGGFYLSPHVDYALRSLKSVASRVILVVDAAALDYVPALVEDLAPDLILPFGDQGGSIGAGYKAALQHLWAEGATGQNVLLTGAHVAGPLMPLDPRALDPAAHGADMFSSYPHKASLDIRLKSLTALSDLPYLDFAVFSPDLMANPDFQAFWQALPPSVDYWEEFLNLTLGLAGMLNKAGRQVIYPAGAETFETSDPRQMEIHKVVAHGMPCFPLSVLHLDPIMHDLNAIDLRIALDALRDSQPDLYAAVIRFATRNVPMRDFNTIADQYEILPEEARSPGKTDWSFGRVAVFIHAFYAEMMPEFWALLQKLPCPHDLFITTSTPEHKSEIEGFLDDHGFAAFHRDVRVVEQNRGRDMSSLFITFQDVILGGRYEVALRLHSKRTPQVSRQVGESFKKHLFDNLVKSPGYVSNVLDMFEQQPDIGMIQPPVVHIGFGTLGHSWFNNRTALQGLAQDMGIAIPYDPDTPVAAYGTMYWFRTKALYKMFEWNWRWEDYNPEPHHIDGGLAHVQERLICYCAQDAGFRVVSVMNPELAARNYAKLEYKLQRLSARLLSGNIAFQVQQLDNLGQQSNARLFRRLTEIYGWMIRRFPASRRVLKPLSVPVIWLLSGRTRDKGI